MARAHTDAARREGAVRHQGNVLTESLLARALLGVGVVTLADAHFLVLSIGPRSELAKSMVQGWRGLSAVREAFDFTPPYRVFEMPTGGAAFLLVDDDEGSRRVALEALRYLRGIGLRPMVGLAREEQAITSEDWDSAARLSALAGVCVVLPTDNAAHTLADFVGAWASALTGRGNFIGLLGEDLQAITAPPCVGSFGAWKAGAGALLLHEEFGLFWGPPARSAFVVVEGGIRSSLAEVNELINELDLELPRDGDLLFCTSFDEEEKPMRALLTVLSSSARRERR